MLLEHLVAAHSYLTELAHRIRASGPVAPSHCWIEEYVVTRADRSYYYQRLASDRPQFGQSGKSRILHLGKVGSPKHRDWLVRLQRRDRLLEIERRAAMLQQLIELEQRSPLWTPDC